MDTIRGGLKREREALMIAVRTAEILTAIWAGNEVSTAENVYRHQIQKKKQNNVDLDTCNVERKIYFIYY